MVVEGVRSGGSATARLARRGGDLGFSLAAAGGAAAQRTSACAASVSIGSLLAMQEAHSDEQRDQEASSHAESVLDALQELQRALLGAETGDLERLERLVARPVVAASPQLASLVSAVRVRAAVELARRRLSDAQP